jgi:hypothetical protein
MKTFTLCVLIALLCAVPAFANTPGKHSVALTWVGSTTAGVTYNVYKGTAAGVCNGTPTPYTTGILTTQFVDTTGLTDGQTVFYNVSAVKAGAESNCDGEVTVQIPVLPAPPSGLQGTPQ